MQNFYTAAQARERLGITKSSFFYLVKKGTIKKVVFPGRKQGVYPRSHVDQLAASIKALLDQYEPSYSFEPAAVEDLPKEVAIDRALYGEQGTTPLERRVERLERNPESNFVLRFSGEVVGHTAFYPVDREYLQKLLRAEVSGIPPDMVLPWLAGTPLSVFISIISVKPGFASLQAANFGRRLIAGSVAVFRLLGSRGVMIESISATTRTADGIVLAQGLGMTGGLIGDEPGRYRFTLEIASSDSLLVEEYRQGLKEYTRLHP